MEIDPKSPLIIELRKSKFDRVVGGIKGIFYFLLFLILAFGLIGAMALEDDSEGNFTKTNVDWYGNTVYADKSDDTKEYIAIVHINGTIASEQDSLYDGTTSESALRMLNDIEQDPFVRAVIIKIDSPGGTVIDSDKIAQKIKEISETKEVYALAESMAASGGYYIAAQTDKIFAHRESLVGSIGVILEVPNAKELFEKIGVDVIAITSGEMKDMGSLFSTLGEEERAIFQELVNESYENFVNEVANGRNMPTAEVRKLADGRIYSAKQALDNGLIDSIDGLNGLQAQLIEDGLANAQLIDYTEYTSPWDEILNPVGEAMASIFPQQKSSKFMLYYK